MISVSTLMRWRGEAHIALRMASSHANSVSIPVIEAKFCAQRPPHFRRDGRLAASSLNRVTPAPVPARQIE